MKGTFPGPIMLPISNYINKIIEAALTEDGYKDDITTNILVPKADRSTAHILVKEDAVVCGIDIAKNIFKRLDRSINFRSFVKDGDKVGKNTILATLTGPSRPILTGERTALNFLSHLSGIATSTSEYVKQVRPYKVKILSTRKTTPGLRVLEKYAVRCGGGENHRQDLSEMVLVKDNHQEVCRQKITIAEAVKQLKKRTRKKIEVEVDNIEQFKEALGAGADIILLDNMPTAQMNKAVKLTRPLKRIRRPLLEASGGVTLKNVRSIARTGVDRISVGALTHSHRATDVSMEFIKK